MRGGEGKGGKTAKELMPGVKDIPEDLFGVQAATKITEEEEVRMQLPPETQGRPFREKSRSHIAHLGGR